MSKVIGKTTTDTYLIEVHHGELEKFMNLYFNNMERLKVGDDIDLSKGYKFHEEIQAALKQSQAFIEANAKTINAINNGLLVLKNIPKSAIKKIKTS